MSRSSLIIFHRCGGKSLGYPPNTLVTIRWAIGYGAKAIEYDVVYCNDGGNDRLIIVEPKLLKLANLDINNLQWEDVKKLNAGNEKYGHQYVLEFEEVFDLINTASIHQQVHIKGKHPKTVGVLLGKLNGKDNFSITSFDVRLLRTVKDINNSVKVGWIVKPKQEKGNEGSEDLTALVTAHPDALPTYVEEEIVEIVSTARENGINIIILCGPRIREGSIIERIQKQGFEVGSWGIGANITLAEQLINFHIDRFTIDNPEELR